MHKNKQPSNRRQHLARLLAGTVALACAGVMPATQAGAATAPSQGTPAATGSVHQTKPGIVRNGTWFLRDTPTTGAATVPAFQYGNPDDFPLMGDWDGNGTSTPAIWRNGFFFQRNANTTGQANATVRYGNPDDFPIVGDWDGDGTDTIGVWRNGQWFLRNSNTSGVADIAFSYGGPEDLALVGDWDNDGDDTAGVARLDDGVNFFQYFLRTTNTTGAADLPVQSEAIDQFVPFPIVADFDGNGTEDVNSFDFGTGIWHTPTIGSFAYGNPDDFDFPVTWGTRG
jgi:hypothetical protein